MHVLGKVVGVVEVDEPLVVRLHHVGRQQHALGEVLGDLASHVVALHRVDGGVLVGVLLLDLLVVALDERENLVVGGVFGALQALHVTVDDVLARDLELVELHELVLDEVLHLLDRDGVAGVLARLGNVLRSVDHLALGQAVGFLDLAVGGTDRILDLGDVKNGLAATALDDLHVFLELSLSR